jgi:chromosome segregation ATPase
MRSVPFIALGGLELVIAGLLIHLGSSIPSRNEVAQGFDGMEGTTRSAARQVDTMRRQIHDVRRPEMRQVADRLQKQTDTVTTAMKRQHVDFETVATLRDSLRDSAKGLDSLAESLDAQKLTRLGTGLGETAKFLDETVAPASAKAADELDAVTESMARDGKNVAELLRGSAPDLKAAREIHDSLGRFDEGLEKMLKLLELKRLDAIKEGFSGLESSLSTTAGEVERLSGYKYPKLRVAGLKVEMEEKPFWPNGDKIADGLRKATEGVRAAREELDGVSSDVPQLRKSLEESRKVVAQTRTALGDALKQQDKLEPLLRDIPARTAKLAEELPRLGQELAKLLRQTKHLREVAAALRQTQQGIDLAVSRWPEVRTGLRRSADLLRVSSTQLDHALANRDDYEAALKETTELAETFGRAAPLFTEEIHTQLAEQERGLRDLATSLDQVGNTLPAYRKSTIDLVVTGQLLAWLVAAAVGLHGFFLVFDNARTKRA